MPEQLRAMVFSSSNFENVDFWQFFQGPDLRFNLVNWKNLYFLVLPPVRARRLAIEHENTSQNFFSINYP